VRSRLRHDGDAASVMYLRDFDLIARAVGAQPVARVEVAAADHTAANSRSP